MCLLTSLLYNDSGPVKKNADLACAQKGSALTEDDIKKQTDYDDKEITITWDKSTITLAPVDKGKFDGVDFTDYECDLKDGETSCTVDGVNITKDSMTIPFTCSD